MLPELLQAIASSRGGTLILLMILYVVIGFGIFGTVMMMTVERTREFGMTIAIGMKRGRLMAVTFAESVGIALMGAFAGLAASVPIVVYFHAHPIQLSGDMAQSMIAYGFEPILPVSIDPMVFLTQWLVVMVLALLSALYPLVVLRTLDPCRAMRS